MNSRSNQFQQESSISDIYDRADYSRSSESNEEFNPQLIDHRQNQYEIDSSFNSLEDQIQIPYYNNDESDDDSMLRDSLINDLTQTQVQRSRDPEGLDEDTRKRINQELHTCISKFAADLLTKITRKTQEISKIRDLLLRFKVCEDLFQEENAYSRNNQKRYQCQMKEHLNHGTVRKPIICDFSITPFFFSFNETLIFITQVPQEYHDQTLELLDNYLRYNNAFVVSTNSGRRKYLQVTLNDGLLQFRLKCCPMNNDPDRQFYDILNLCCALNETFTSVCAFMAYWADRRGILSDNYLTEQALYCMIIEYFQLNELLPQFFHESYCNWSQNKKNLMKQLLEDKYVTKQKIKETQIFQDDEYLIIHKRGLRRQQQKERDRFSYVHFHSFPRVKDKDFVKKIWDKTKNRRNTTNNNLGALVTSIFYHYSNLNSSRRKIDITATRNDPYLFEIGFKVMSPIIPGLSLTKKLHIRRGQDRTLPYSYLSVKEEFQRAYDLIISCKFKEICEKRKTFIVK